MGTILDRKKRSVDLKVMLGERLAELRNAAEVTQEDVAAVMGIARAGVSKIEHGQRRLTAIELFDYIRALDLASDGIYQELDQLIVEYDSSAKSIRK